MKIKYKKIIRSTEIEPSALLKNVIDELNKAGYQITNQTQSGVEFKNNIWGPGSRTDVYRKVDGGKFDINSEKNTIGLFYYTSPVFQIIASCIAAFFGIITDYHIFFFIIFIVFTFLIKLMSQQMAGNRLMENVLNPEQS
jgi:hypothetical protein